MSFHRTTLDYHHGGRWILGLNVCQGTNPISKAPYRMASPELKELKEQL
jgi:hypothetical protein